MEEEIVIEEVIADFCQTPNSSEEAGDESLNSELINSSFLFDEEKDNSTSDVVRLTPPIVDEVGFEVEVQNYNGEAYQEGKPFNSTHDFLNVF
ncbi:hypothetical protein MKW92_014370, partial [Papaver armeniacum]